MDDNYHWICPRCHDHFDDIADARAHTCEQNPAEWHAENSVGGVTHAPDYNGSFYTGAQRDCTHCFPN